MSLDSVKAQLNYSHDIGRPIDYYFYEPDPGTQKDESGTDLQDVNIFDGWPEADNFNIDVQGFEIRDLKSSFNQFEDDAALKENFYATVIEFVKKHTGAKEVVVFDHTLRRRLASDLKAQTEVQRPAVLLVHSDYTEKSARQRVRDIMGDRAEQLLSNRVAFYNVWKPLYETVEELPLAMCDARTSTPEDMLLMNLKYRDRTGEIYVVRKGEDHRWYYFPRMPPDKALLLKTYDSEKDGRARFTPHTAFEDPNTPPNALKRQSIEIRTMAFF
ncbi:MAG: CmcJ/NvfI family oxidoreductase [Hyphomicrobiaceae bacterium]